MNAQIVNHIETAVVYVLVLSALFLVRVAVVELKKLSGHVKTFVVAHTTEKERALLDALVKDAVPYVKTLYPELNPMDIIQKAADHVTALAVQKGLNFNQQEVSAAVGALLSVLGTGSASPAVKPQPTAAVEFQGNTVAPQSA